MKLSVIMPVYSETDSVRRIIDDISVRLKEHLLEVILIVSPRSSEESLAVCKSVEAGNRLVRMIMQSEKPGFGQAYREAFPAARGDFVLMLDADGEFDLDSVPLMIREIEGGADGVLASRWIPGGGVEGYGFTTYLANRSFQILLRALFHTRLHDLTFGFKMLSASIVRTISWEGTMHELAMETTIKPLRYGYRLAEVPAFWRKRREGKSKNKSLLWRAQRYLPLMMRVKRSAPPPGTPVYLPAGRQVPNASCLLCGEHSVNVIATKGIISKGGSTAPVRNVVCTGCGLVFQNPQPKAEDLDLLARSYTEERHGFDSRDELRRYISGVSWKNKGQALGSFLSEFIKPETRVLDLGCGPGLVIKYLREKFDCQVLGVEPSTVAVEFAKAEYGLPVFAGTINDFLLQSSEADFGAIILHHVLEHLSDPVATLGDLRSRMAPGGVLYVEVPDVSNFSKPVDQFFDAMHLWSFTPPTLRMTLARGGFKIIRWNRSKRYRIQVAAVVASDTRKEISKEEFPAISSEEIMRTVKIKRLRDKTVNLARNFIHPRSRP